MLFFIVAFIITLIVGHKVIKMFKKKPTKSVSVEEGGVPQPIETQEIKEPIKAVKIAGVRIDIKGIKEKSLHLCEGLKHIIEVER